MTTFKLTNADRSVTVRLVENTIGVSSPIDVVRVDNNSVRMSINQTNGTVKLNNVSRSINVRQVDSTIEVIQVGRQGAKGDKGDPGDTGATGAQGPQGEQGVQGAKGDKGDQGIQGEQGEQGTQGIQGIQGETGPQGPQGNPGEGVPVGGTTGQIATKASDTDYDVTWSDAPEGNSGMRFQDEELTSTYAYSGYEHLTDGSWYIYRRTRSTNVREYATGSSGYAAAWTTRESGSYS